MKVKTARRLTRMVKPCVFYKELGNEAGPEARLSVRRGAKEPVQDGVLSAFQADATLSDCTAFWNGEVIT